MSYWNVNSSTLRQIKSEYATSIPHVSTMVCTNCHRSYTRGKFCSECGSILKPFMSHNDPSIMTEVCYPNSPCSGEYDIANVESHSFKPCFCVDPKTSIRTDSLTSHCESKDRHLSIDLTDDTLMLGKSYSTLGSPYGSIPTSPYMCKQALTPHSFSVLKPKHRSSASASHGYYSGLSSNEDLNNIDYNGEISYSEFSAGKYVCDESYKEPELYYDQGLKLFDDGSSCSSLYPDSPFAFQNTSCPNKQFSTHFRHSIFDEDLSITSPVHKATRSYSEANIGYYAGTFDPVIENSEICIPDAKMSNSGIPEMMERSLHFNRRNSIPDISSQLKRSISQSSMQTSSESSVVAGSMFFSGLNSCKTPPIDVEPSGSMDEKSGESRESSSSNVVDSHEQSTGSESSGKSKKGGYSKYRGRVVELACTQNGSKGLQNYLNSLSSSACTSIISKMIKEIAPTGCTIICDTFGNYFYQLLFKKATLPQKEKLLRSLLFKESHGSNIFDVSVNKTGTFALQNIIDFMNGDHGLGQLLVTALTKGTGSKKGVNVTLRLIQEAKGTHIIQRIMKSFSPEVWNPVFDVILQNAVEIAKDKNGSMVFRLCYDLVDWEKREKLAEKVVEAAFELAVDPVGNYVVQYILGTPENSPSLTHSVESAAMEQEKLQSFTRRILAKLAGRFVELSKQKHSSNVVEKLCSQCIALHDTSLVTELLDERSVIQLLDNHYGIYVLQKTLQTLGEDELQSVDSRIRGSNSFSGNHGSLLLTKWKQVINRATYAISN